MHLENDQRNLPHRLPSGTPLFLTCRLSGSLSGTVVAALKQQFAPLTARQETPTEYHARQRGYFGRFDDLLADATSGPTWLREPAVAARLLELLRLSDGVYDTLHTVCVMPNHLHVVLTTPLTSDRPFIRSWQGVKGYAAREANRRLGRTGQVFWQPETYDHVVRDAAELARIVRYTVFNPVEANLCGAWSDWPSTYLRSDWVAEIDRATG